MDAVVVAREASRLLGADAAQVPAASPLVVVLAEQAGVLLGAASTAPPAAPVSATDEPTAASKLVVPPRASWLARLFGRR